MSEEKRTRQQDAVLVCLANSDGPLTTTTMIAAFAKAGSKRRFGQEELNDLLAGLKKQGLVDEVGNEIFRITGQGRTALGPVAERPLSEI